LIPIEWSKQTFQTAYTSLADFLVELDDKLEFWNIVIENYKRKNKMSLFYLPAFYDVTKFLNALRQKRARMEEITTHDMVNEFIITNHFDKLPEEEQVYD